uniref:Putative secreted protein n=1 Tax=Anopheles darlingi TaxID=43151 RepID=A0A2M4DE80_ANODA
MAMATTTMAPMLILLIRLNTHLSSGRKSFAAYIHPPDALIYRSILGIISPPRPPSVLADFPPTGPCRQTAVVLRSDPSSSTSAGV